MRIKKLELQNFQSHKWTVIEFDNNFNCIVGPSRAGKSSIVRALSFLFFDEWYDDWIRKGTNSVVVRVLLDNGYLIEREKGSSVNKITVTTPDGKTQVFEKFGVEAPPEVKKILCVTPVQVDIDYSINLNLADQDSLPFLLSDSSIAKTKFLNRLTGSHIIDIALRELNKDKLLLTEDNRQCEEDLIRLEKELEKYKNIEQTKLFFNSLSTKFEQTEKMLSRYYELINVQSKLNNIRERKQKITTFLDWYNKESIKVLQIAQQYITYSKLLALQQCLQRLDRVKQLLEKTIHEEEQLIKQFKVCPFCGNVLKEGQKVCV